MKFIVSSYLLPHKGSFSNVKISKDIGNMQGYKVHGLYSEDHIIITKNPGPYPTNINLYAYPMFIARNWYYPHFETSNRKMKISYGSFVKKSFLENIGNVKVLIGNLQRGDDSFVFEQLVRNNNTVYIEYNFSTKNAREYDYDGNEIASYNIYLGKDEFSVMGGWADKDKYMANVFYAWYLIIWNKFNPLVEYPFIMYNHNHLFSVLIKEKNISGKILLGSVEMDLDPIKFLIVRPSDNKIFKVNSSGTFDDVTASVDLDDYSSFNSNANDYKDYLLVENSTWENLMGTDNDFLYFVNNNTLPYFILKYDVYNLTDSDFIYIRKDDVKPLVIKDQI